MLQQRAGWQARPDVVSILTRPEGRVLHAERYIVGWLNRAFQSSPGPKAGCYPGRHPYWRAPCRSFNPHPARRPGATPDLARAIVGYYWVSILTRPEGRVLRSASWSSNTVAKVFQSSPGPKAGCYRPRERQSRQGAACFNPHPARRPGATSASTLAGARPARFNPHPARRPGATGRWSTLGAPSGGFNPHPARRPGATGETQGERRAHEAVSILTRPEGRVLQLGAEREGFAVEVSILTRPEGWVLRAREAQHPLAPAVSILTRPEGRVLRRRGVPHDLARDVSILTRPEGRVLLRLRFRHRPPDDVSILTRPEGRVLPRAEPVDRRVDVVSILTRPEGRVLRGDGTAATQAAQRVSILTRPEGRVLLPPAARLRAAGRCFNPHPARRPGATFPVRQERIVLLRVSILTRPEGRVLRFALFVRRGAASCRFLREPSDITVPGSLDIEAAHAHILSCRGNSVARTPACLGDTPGPRKGASDSRERFRQ